MQMRSVNPWTWQDNFGFSQAVEITGQQRILLCAGQTSVDGDGNPVFTGDMAGQINKAFDNLEEVLKQAGMSLANVARINIYTTDLNAFYEAVPAWNSRLAAGNCKPATTLLVVAGLAFPEIMIEIEATAVA